MIHAIQHKPTTNTRVALFTPRPIRAITHSFSLIFKLAFIILALSSLAVKAQDQAYDCTIVSLDEIDQSNLSKEQRIALLEQSLQDSIDSYEYCISVITTNTSNSGGGAGGGGGSEGGGSGSSNSNSQGEGNSEASEGQASTQGIANRNNRDNQDRPAGSGAQDQKVEAKDNDAAVCELLREELQLETDPNKKQQLRDIYKDYRC